MIHEMMKENELSLQWLFSHARLADKEGIIFFEVSTETDEKDVEFQALTPKCILIDGAKFLITEDNEHDITINTLKDEIILNRVDGLEVKLSKGDFVDIPFHLEEFSKVKLQFSQPQDTVEVAD